MEYSNEFMKFNWDPTQMSGPSIPAPRRRKKESDGNEDNEETEVPQKKMRFPKVWPDSIEPEDTSIR